MNNFIENTSNIDEISTSCANTYLGNFCFNSTSTGAPNNTNYNIEGLSDITGKFSTISQSSSFVDRPTRWTNINMIP